MIDIGLLIDIRAEDLVTIEFGTLLSLTSSRKSVMNLSTGYV